MSRKTMSYVEAMALAEFLRGKLESAGKYPQIHLDDGFSWGCGGIDDAADPGSQCEIGIQWPCSDKGKEIRVGIALRPFVAICHEVFGHVDQIRLESQYKNPLSKAILINYLACRGSFSYYFCGGGSQYYRQTHEIAAEYAGMKCAYGFLSQLYDENAASEMMLDYVNAKIEDLSSCVRDKDVRCKTFPEALRAYNKIFNMSIFSDERDYVLPVSYAADYEPPNDVVRQFADANGLDHGQIVSFIGRYPDGFSRDLAMVHMYISLHADEDVCNSPAVLAAKPLITDVFDKNGFKAMLREIPYMEPFIRLHPLDQVHTSAGDIPFTDEDIRKFRDARGSGFQKE